MSAYIIQLPKERHQHKNQPGPITGRGVEKKGGTNHESPWSRNCDLASFFCQSQNCHAWENEWLDCRWAVFKTLVFKLIDGTLTSEYKDPGSLLTKQPNDMSHGFCTLLRFLVLKAECFFKKLDNHVKPHAVDRLFEVCELWNLNNHLGWQHVTFLLDSWYVFFVWREGDKACLSLSNSGLDRCSVVCPSH